MKANPHNVDKALALLVSRANIPSAALPVWRSHAEKIASAVMSDEDIYSLCLVEYLSRVVGKSIELGDGRKWADGSSYDSASKTWSAPKKKQGQRRNVTLSDTDKEEIRGEIPRVLSFLGAWSRPLTSDDWSKLFSRVQSADCLDLNRKWKPSPDGEATLAKLSAPTFDLEREASRLEALAEKAEEAREWIEAAFAEDTGRKRKATRAKMLSTLETLLSGGSVSGRGNDLREQKRERAEFTAYLAKGKAARARARLTKSTWLPPALALA